MSAYSKFWHIEAMLTLTEGDPSEKLAISRILGSERKCLDSSEAWQFTFELQGKACEFHACQSGAVMLEHS